MSVPTEDAVITFQMPFGDAMQGISSLYWVGLKSRKIRHPVKPKIIPAGVRG
jgi:hypothetical protein